jgi:hypothetical protein
MARSRSRGAPDEGPAPLNTVRFAEPWSAFARGGLVPRREIPIDPQQPEQYRYRINICVVGDDGRPSYRRVEYDSPVQIRPENLQLVVEVTLRETGRGTYRHGRRIGGPVGSQPCGATVESITRRE